MAGPAWARGPEVSSSGSSGPDGFGGGIVIRLASTTPARSLDLPGRRVHLSTLVDADYEAWYEVRSRCRDWLVPWEPRSKGAPLPPEDAASFAARCAMRERERQLGTGFGFGIFADGRFAGEVTLSSIQRGPFQNGSVGYWVDQRLAGCGLVPEAVVVVLQYAFEALRLHRIEVAIIPRNRASRRVVEKLGLRDEGVARGFLEINGRWEDHLRYAMTAEEWGSRGGDLTAAWLTPL